MMMMMMINEVNHLFLPYRYRGHRDKHVGLLEMEDEDVDNVAFVVDDVVAVVVAVVLDDDGDDDDDDNDDDGNANNWQL